MIEGDGEGERDRCMDNIAVKLLVFFPARIERERERATTKFFIQTRDWEKEVRLNDTSNGGKPARLFSPIYPNGRYLLDPVE